MLEANSHISKNLEKFLEKIIIELNIKISRKCKKEVFSFCLSKIHEISFKTGETCEEKFKKILSDEIFFFVLIKIKL